MKTKELVQRQVMKQRSTPSTIFKKLMDRKSVCVLLCLLFSAVIGIITSSIVTALERPTAEQIEQYERDGTLAERRECVQCLGNYKASPSFVARSHYTLHKLSLQLKGYTPSEIDGILAPPPYWQGLPTAGNVKFLALLIDFPDYTHSNSSGSIESKLWGGGSFEERG